MARLLVVGCGCRGRSLAGAAVERGHAVRGTTRDARGVPPIEATGAEAVVADPGRLGTLTPVLEGVSLLVWLMGTATGSDDEVAALHGPRLESMLDAIVDTPVRGVVLEGRGSVAQVLLEGALAIGRRAEATHRMPVEVIGSDPGEHQAWLREAVQAAERVLAR